MDKQPDYLPILRRCGIVFVLLILIQVGVFIFCVVNSIPFNSSVEVVSLIGGILLIRGNLGAAAFMQWYSWFVTALMIGWLVVLPALLPIDLIWVFIKLHSVTTLLGLVLLLILTSTYLRLAIQLGSAPVALARADAGRKPIKVLIPTILGVLLPPFVSVLVVKLQSSTIGQRAVAEAREVQGDDYQFVLTRIQGSWGPQGAWYSGTVTAWNAQEIISVPVSWSEKRQGSN